MPAKSLLQLALAVAIKNVKLLDDIGDLPYSVVRPILMKVDNPEKLHSMEKLSPQLLGEDKELWIEFIKRDIPQWEQYDLPEHSKDWYGIYSDLRAELQRALDADAEKMKMALDGIQSQKQRLVPKIISGPRTKGGQWSRSTLGSRFRPARPDPFSVPKKKQTPFTPQRRNNALAVPTKHLHTRQSQVQRAPRSLIEVHRRPEPVAPSSSKRPENPPRLPVPPGTSSSSLAEREARLRAIAAGQQPPPLSNPEPSRKRPLPSSSHTSPPLDSGGPSNRAPQAPSRAPAQSPPASAPARPVIPRKRPDSVFIQPKRRRLV